MTKADKDEIKGLLNDGISHIKEINDLNIKNLHDKLDSIITQTTLTSGTVRKHTEQIMRLESKLPHSLDDCPQKDVINRLRDNMMRAQFVSKKSIIATITVTGIITGIIVSIIELIIK